MEVEVVWEKSVDVIPVSVIPVRRVSGLSSAPKQVGWLQLSSAQPAPTSADPPPPVFSRPPTCQHSSSSQPALSCTEISRPLTTSTIKHTERQREERGDWCGDLSVVVLAVRLNNEWQVGSGDIVLPTPGAPRGGKTKLRGEERQWYYLWWWLLGNYLS